MFPKTAWYVACTMLELQQQNILRHPARKLPMLNIDAGSVQSRRSIDQ